MTLSITITNAGRAELINAINTGTDPVLIAEVGLGTGQYTPTATQTALVAETKRLTAFGGDVVADDTIHVFIKDESGDAYNVSEIGLYTGSGTLFAVYSQVGNIIQKTSATTLLLAVDVIFAAIDATTLTFGDTSFVNPPATTTALGVVELATQPEMDAGTDVTRVPPVNIIATYIANALASKLNSSAYTAADVKTKLLTVDGSGSGVDADLLDGQHGSYYTNASNMNAGTLPAARLPASTTSVSGAVELATQTEMNAGTDPARVPAVNVIATYVAAQIAGLVDSSPTTLDTLNELAAALGDDANFATTMTNALAGKSNTGHIHSADNIISGTLHPDRLPPPTTTDRGGHKKATLTSDVYVDNETGWVMQHGVVTVAASATIDVTLPLAYTIAHDHGVGCYQDGGSGAESPGVKPLSLTQIRIKNWGSSQAIAWISTGRITV